MRHWRDYLNLEKFNQITPLICVVLIIYLCWKLATLFWLMLAPMQVLQFQQVQLGSQQQTIPNIHHFSLFKANSSAGPIQNLNLSLQGVVIGTPSRFSSAVIKANNVAERYRVGEYVADTDYQLAHVYWDKVVLTGPNGAAETLKMAAMESLNQDLSLNAQQNAANPTMPAHMPAGAATSTEQAMGQAVQQLQQNRDQYLQNMGTGNDGAEGYAVSPRTPLVLRRKLGLQPGDRVLSLNGQRLSAGQNEAQLLEQARQSGQVKLEVQRGDQVITIQQDIN
jgi:general secretion pathway protein C